MAQKSTQMTVTQYRNFILEYTGEKPTRHQVYKMITNGIINGKKDELGKWIITVYEYAVKEYVDLYNKKNPEAPTNANKVRQLIIEKKLNAKKVNLKWVILEASV